MSSEDFEDGLATGWGNGAAVNSAHPGTLTSFLLYPLLTFKTFTVDPAASSLLLTFNFYEIDEWNSASPDFFLFFFRGDAGFGAFVIVLDRSNDSLGATTGDFGSIESHPASFVRTFSPSQHLGFDADFREQIHQLSIEIPAVYSSTNQLTLGFYNGGVTNAFQRGGIDNVQVGSCFGGATSVSTPVPTNIVAPPFDLACPVVENFVEVGLSDFETGDTTGWTEGTVGTLANMNAALFFTSTFRTYQFSATTTQANILFDFYEIDEWLSTETDAFHFVFWGQDGYGGFSVSLSTADDNLGTTSGVFGNLGPSAQWLRSPGTSAALGGSGGVLDQLHSFEVEIPLAYFVTDRVLTLGFYITQTSSSSTQQGALDNVDVRGCF